MLFCYHAPALLYRIIGCLMVITLSSCSLFRAQDDTLHKEPPLNLQKLSIHLDEDANLDSATTIDIAIIDRPELLQKLMQMSAVEFNDKIDQLRRDYPKIMKIFHFELTPGQTLDDVSIDTSCQNIGAVVFANYFTPGDHRIRIGDARYIHIELKKYDFCIAEQGCDSIPNFGNNNRQISAGHPSSYAVPISQLAVQPSVQTYPQSQDDFTQRSTAPAASNTTPAQKPSTIINEVHNNIAGVKKTVDTTQSLIKALPFK